MDKSGRKTIGLLVGGIMDNFSISVCRGAILAAKEVGVKLIIFPGKYLHRDLKDRKEIIDEYQYNTIFSYARKENLDAVMISADSIGCYAPAEKTEEMISRYIGIPCVLIASKKNGFVSVNFDNSSGVKEAINYLVQHLNCRKLGMIGGTDNNADARERKQAFMNALEEQGIAFEKKRYVEGNLTRYPHDIFQKFLDDNKDIEAVFCVNDETAIGFYETLKEYKMYPGKKVYVFGYDNIFLATKLKPTLSTVWADPVLLGEHAVQMVLELLEGKEVQSRQFPTKFIKRDSFGISRGADRNDELQRVDYTYIYHYFEDIFYRYAHGEKDERFEKVQRDFHLLMEMLILVYEQEQPQENLKNIVIKRLDVLLEHDALDYADMERFIEHVEIMYQLTKNQYADDLKKQQIRDVFASVYRKIILAIEQRYGEMYELQEEEKYDMKIFVKNTMQFEKGNDQSYYVLLANLGWLGIKNASLYLFEKPIMHLQGEKYEVPRIMYRKAVLKDGEVQSVNAATQKVSVENMFCTEAFYEQDKPQVLFPLFENEMQYGLLLCDMTEKLYENGDFVINQLGVAAKMIELLRANAKIQRQLEESLVAMRENNIVLDTLSKQDGLTGILNRRGFMEEAQKVLVDNQKKGTASMVVYIDMNNLKVINDRYGHEEGDFSICAISEVLIKLVGERGIVGRIGGDEFATTIELTTKGEEQQFLFEIESAFEEFNTQSDKPYNITVSAGGCVITADTSMNKGVLQEALAIADEKLYEQKKLRTRAVAKDEKR